MKYLALTAGVIFTLIFGSCGPVKPEGTVVYMIEPFVQSVTENSAVIAWKTEQIHLGFIRVNDTMYRIKERKSHHVFTVTGLKPDTEYTYLVNNIKKGTFRTFSDNMFSRLTVAVYGNTAKDIKTHTEIAAALEKEKPDIILHTGNALTDMDSTDQLFGPLKNLAADIPVFGVPGDLPWQRKLYSFNAGPVHAVFVDTGLSIDEMKEQVILLRDDLMNDTHPWKIAVLSVSPFSTSKGGVDEQTARLVFPVLFKYGVNMVFAGGNDTYYLRSKPMYDAMGNLITLVVSGGGGALSDPPQGEYVLTSDKSNHHCIFSFSNDKVEGYAVRTDGRKIDAFSISREELKRDKVMGAVSYKDILTDLTVKKWITARAVINGSIQPNTVVPCIVTLSRSPYKDVSCTVDWKRDNTTWNVKPKKETKTLSTSGETEFTFHLDFWGEVYPVLEPSVTLEYNGKKYSLATDLAVPAFREMHIIEMPVFPTIDGYVTEKEVESLKKSLPFLSYTANREAEIQTQVYAGVFGKSLYFGIVNFDPAMSDMKTAKRERDGAVREDHCDEILIGVPGDKDIYHFILSSSGSAYDARGKDVSWNGNWQGEAARMNDKWSAEFLIPVKDIGKDLKPGEDITILLNICRNNPTAGEYSQWSRTFGSKRNPEYYGKAVILRK